MNERFARVALAAVFFLYVLAMRTYDVATTFLMLGEQTRDWTIALGGITELPLVGAPSTAGGRGFGPAYYWLLWLGRATIGPFMDNLPHAGGVTVALLQSVADAWLFVALSRRVHWGLALATCLLIASGPFDIAISSVIWNPPVSAALIKMATASALTIGPPTPLRGSHLRQGYGGQAGATSSRGAVILTATLAWMAVQAHLSAIFVAAPLLLGVALQPLLYRREVVFVHETAADYRRQAIGEAGKAIVIVVAIVLLLQVPFIISLISEPSAQAGPSSAIANLTSGQAWKPMAALDTVTGITGNLFLPMPDSFTFWIPTVVCGLILLFVYRRDSILLGATIGSVLTATIVFSTWTRSYDRYWFLTMTTALALTFAMTIAAVPSKAVVKWIGLALVLLIASWQPARIAESERFFEYPQYETMVRASRDLITRAPVVRGIKVTFDVHPTMDTQFIYKILGGRIDPAALYTAIVNADGSVRLATD